MNDDLWTWADSQDDGPEHVSKLQRDFDEFHAQNPHVYELFKRFAFVVANAGYERYSSRAVIERLRWHVNFETTTAQAGEFKLNDHLTPYYARLFMADHPHLGEFFETRRLRS